MPAEIDDKLLIWASGTPYMRTEAASFFGRKRFKN
jgi:hypothetical protein